MKTLFMSIILILTTNSAIAHFDGNCPQDAGETNVCDNETSTVSTALLQLKDKQNVTEKTYSYCLNEVSTPGQTGLQCRSLSLFYKVKGDGSLKLLKDLFIDRFVSSEARRFSAWTTYIVKNDSGVYERHVDHLNDGVLRVDQHRTLSSQIPYPFPGTFSSDASVNVSFSKGFPAYEAFYFIDTRKLKFTQFHTKLNDPMAENDNFRVYTQLNSPSVGAMNTDAEWSKFFEKEGLSHSGSH